MCLNCTKSGGYAEWNKTMGDTIGITPYTATGITPYKVTTTESLPNQTIICNDKGCKVKTLSIFQARKIRTLPSGKDVLALAIPVEMKSAHDDDDEKNRTITFVASTEAKDRMGDVIMQDGFVLKNFRKNPVFLWAHNSFELPIGRVKRTKVEDGKLMATVEFATADENPHADLVFRLYKGGFLHAVSVGFQALEFEPLDENDTSFFAPLRFTKVDLLEISAVNVPANPQALISATEKGIITSDERKSFETMSRGHTIETEIPAKVKLAPDMASELLAEASTKDFSEEADRLRTVRDAIDMTITYLDARAGEQPDEPIDPGIEVVDDTDADDVLSTKSLLEEINDIVSRGSGPLQEPESGDEPTDKPMSENTFRILTEIVNKIRAEE